MSEVIYCDQCNSDNVVIKNMEQPYQESRRPMSSLMTAQMVNGKPEPLNFMAVPYKAVCFDCGNSVEWSA